MESLAGGAAVTGIGPLAVQRFSSLRLSRRSRIVACGGDGKGLGDVGGGLPELDEWEQMELKFGRLIGEDPKLTLAKVMAKKANPDLSGLEVEKLIAKKKYKLEDFIAMAQEVSMDRTSSKVTNRQTPTNKAANQKTLTTSELNLVRPVMGKAAQASTPIKMNVPVLKKPDNLAVKSSTRSSMSDVALRKPTLFPGDVDKLEEKLKERPVLKVKMREDMDENLGGITLIKRPEPMQMQMQMQMGLNQEITSRIELDEFSKMLGPSDETRKDKVMNNEETISGSLEEDTLNVTTATFGQSNGVQDEFALNSSEFSTNVKEGLQPAEQSSTGDVLTDSVTLGERSMHADEGDACYASLLGKPQRIDLSAGRLTAPTVEDSVEDATCNDDAIASSIELDIGDDDWQRVENLQRTGKRVEVELISGSKSGFVVSYDSLIGFLPYQNLGTKWKFLAFESWLRNKGLDPSLYRKKMGVSGSYEVKYRNTAIGEPSLVCEDNNISPSEPKFEDLLQLYDEEKNKFMSSFVGQRVRVLVSMVDRSTKKILFSGKPKEKEELVEKKRKLMASLSVGDVVKCRIKKFSYYGIFVEVEGVMALIQQSNVSWETTLELSASYKIGQIIDAKVHQLDYVAERIFLSLKDVKPGSLDNAFESIVGEQTSLGGSLRPATADYEWPDVESLTRELLTVEGITSVSKGQFFLSLGLAPTFQVYMAPSADDDYKLLARFENKVQEIIVQTSLGREEMKAAVLACTGKVG